MNRVSISAIQPNKNHFHSVVSSTITLNPKIPISNYDEKRFFFEGKSFLYSFSFPNIELINQQLDFPIVKKHLFFPKWESPIQIFEKSCVYLLSFVLLKKFPDGKSGAELVKFGMTFEDFVKYTKTFFHGDIILNVRGKVYGILCSTIPTVVQNNFKNLCSRAPRFVCEMSSLWMQLGFLSWLVGKTERFDLVVDKSTGQSEIWKSGVKLVECRYLKEAQCKSACLQLCKGPTQDFFNNKLGLPLYMKPNFKDNSCEMCFGVKPPEDALDPAYEEPCFSSCNAFKKMKHKPTLTSSISFNLEPNQFVSSKITNC
eukprot:gene11199-15020_t